jgi:hypothetical protein
MINAPAPAPPSAPRACARAKTISVQANLPGSKKNRLPYYKSDICSLGFTDRAVALENLGFIFQAKQELDGDAAKYIGQHLGRIA